MFLTTVTSTFIVFVDYENDLQDGENFIECAPTEEKADEEKVRYALMQNCTQILYTTFLRLLFTLYTIVCQ